MALPTSVPFLLCRRLTAPSGPKTSGLPRLPLSAGECTSRTGDSGSPGLAARVRVLEMIGLGIPAGYKTPVRAGCNVHTSAVGHTSQYIQCYMDCIEQHKHANNHRNCHENEEHRLGQHTVARVGVISLPLPQQASQAQDGVHQGVGGVPHHLVLFQACFRRACATPWQ